MRRIPVFCLCLAVALAARWTVARAAASAADIGQIEFAAGGVSVRNSEVPAGRPGTTVQLGDVIRTSPASSARLVLAGGASVLVQADSEFRVIRHDAVAEQTTIELARGHVLAQAAADTRDGSELRIETPTAVVSTRDGSVLVRTAPDPISLGVASMHMKISNGASALADAGVTVVVQGIGEPLPAGRTNEQGDADVRLDLVQGIWPDRLFSSPLVDYRRFIKQGFQATAETCDNGRTQIFLVGEDGKLPDEPKKCRRQKLSGAFVWSARKRVTVDIAARTLRAADEPIERAGRTDVGTTMVTAFHRHVAVRDKTATAASVTYLLAGQSAAVDREGGPSSAVRFDYPQLMAAAGQVSNENWYVPALLSDFTAAGKPCQPVWVVDGVLAQSRARYEIEITGTGVSTGSSLQVFATSEWECAVYFMVTDGTVLNPRGPSKHNVASMQAGSGLVLDEFQLMITAGIFIRIAPGAREVRQSMRAYCLQLHKQAPHPHTEYQVSNDDTQRRWNWRRPIVDNGFRLAALKRLTSTTGQSLDVLIQWSLWTQIEAFDQKKFDEEFTALLRKNLEAQKKKWDDAAKRQAAAAMQDMWRVIQIIAPGVG